MTIKAKWMPENPYTSEAMRQGWEQGTEDMAKALLAEIDPGLFSSMGVNVPEAGKGLCHCIDVEDWEQLKRECDLYWKEEELSITPG